MSALDITSRAQLTAEVTRHRASESPVGTSRADA
jgi:hypothetical protein